MAETLTTLDQFSFVNIMAHAYAEANRITRENMELRRQLEAAREEWEPIREALQIDEWDELDEYYDFSFRDPDYVVTGRVFKHLDAALSRAKETADANS